MRLDLKIRGEILGGIKYVMLCCHC